MIRSKKKATAKDQILRIHAAASAMVASANEGQSPERRVSTRNVERIVSRSFAKNHKESFSLRKHRVLRDISDFISMSQKGKSNYSNPLNTDLLPVGNPMSTRKHAMTADAFTAERARWVASDSRIKDTELRSIVASFLTSAPESDASVYYSTRLHAEPLAALVAAFGGGNSRAARSARARAQRRDRKGRFAWMGGGISALIKRTNGKVNRLTGRFVAQGVGGDNTFDIETPDGKLYRVPATSSEAIRAVIPSPDAPDGYSPVEAQKIGGAPTIPEADLVEIDAPQGFKKTSTNKWGSTFYTDDAYNVVKWAKNDPSMPAEYKNADGIDTDKPIFTVSRGTDSKKPGSLIKVTNSWADSQAAIREDEPRLDKEEGRDSDPIARLSDEEFDALADNPDFDPKTLLGEQPEAPEAEAPSAPDETPYYPVAELEDFEYNVPNGAHDIDVSSDYEPQGRLTQESSDYTDDPAVLGESFMESDLSDALAQALLGDDPDNPDGSGSGDLEFEAGPESVPAQALYEALYEAGVDPDMEVAKIYDSALGTTENQDALEAARREAAGMDQGEGVPEPVADLGEVDEAPEVVLPPAIEGASEDERNAFLESGDWTPFLQKNDEFDETGSYNLLDTDPYEPLTDEQRAEAELPDAVFDSPVDLANALPEGALAGYLREAVEPDSEMPGAATVSFEDEDGEIVEAYIPGEAIRDALQLQGVNTNDILNGIYSEPTENSGDVEPTDDEATDLIESIGAEEPEVSAEIPALEDLVELDSSGRVISTDGDWEWSPSFGGGGGLWELTDQGKKKEENGEDLTPPNITVPRSFWQPKDIDWSVTDKTPKTKEPDAELPSTPSAPSATSKPKKSKRSGKGESSKFYSPKPDGTPDTNMEYDADYLKHLYESDLEDLTVAELSDLQAMLDQISPEAKFLVADKEQEVYDELLRRAAMDEPDADTPASDYISPHYVDEDFPEPDADEPERRMYEVSGDLGIMSKDLLKYLQERYGSKVKSQSSKIPKDDLEEFIKDHNGLYGTDLIEAMNAWKSENGFDTINIPEKKSEETPTPTPAEDGSAPAFVDTDFDTLEPKPESAEGVTDGDLSPKGDWQYVVSFPFGGTPSAGWVKTDQGLKKEKDAEEKRIDPFTGESLDKVIPPSTETEELPEMSPEDKFMDEFGLDVDMSDWVKDGGQAGSNEGAFYTDPKTGVRYYVKKPKSAKHARNEALASAFYNEAGVRHGRIYIAKDQDGNEVLVSPIVSGDIKELGKTDWQNDPDILSSAQNGFVMDAWLNNWDSVGMNYDNMIVKDKDVYRIDPGGALIFRAQGEDKSDTLTPEAQQIDDLRFKGKKASSVFGSMTDEQITEDAKKLVGISEERIAEMVDTAFADDPETGDFIKEMLIARRKTIMDRFGLTEDDYPKGKEEAAPEPEAPEAPEAEAPEAEAPEAVDPGINPETGGYSPEMQALVDLFVANPEAAADFLNKVKEDNPDLSPDLVDSLIEKIDKPTPEPKEVPEALADDISSEIADAEVDSIDAADPEIDDSGLEGVDEIDISLDDILDDDTIGDADKIIKKILETYEVQNNGDGTFTLSSTTREGTNGKPEKLEVKIQKNKDNTFSVLFIQTKWNDKGEPIEKIVDKYAPRHSFKALNNNIIRAQNLFDGFQKNKGLSSDKFMKLVSKNTYKKVAGNEAIESVKATHLAADGITELKVGDRVYNWKNGKWGTVASIEPEYVGQGKHKVKEITATGEEVYKYTDYVKVRWDNAPSKALAVVSNALFKVDPETGYAVDTPTPTLYTSKGKPKPDAKQPKKPETPDPQNVSPAAKPTPEPETKPAPEPEQIDLPEPQAAEAPSPEPEGAPTPETDADLPEPVQEIIDQVEEAAPTPTPSVDALPDEVDPPELSDAEAESIIDDLGSSVGKIYNYKGSDVEIVSIDKNGVTYKNVDTGEEGNTPLIYWNQEELDGVVGAPEMVVPSDPDNPGTGDKYTYNASDGTTTEMSLTGTKDNITYQYVDKNGKQKVKTISKEKFKELFDSGKITPGPSNQYSPAQIRDIREALETSPDAPTATGPVPEAAPQVGKAVSEFDLDGSKPLDDFASVEDAVSLAKERKKSGYQHRITYDGDAVADMEVAIGVAKVDGVENVTARLRLQGSVANELVARIAAGDTDDITWTEENGVLIPSRKRLKSGMKIDTTKTLGISSVENSGNTYTAELEDGTKIRVYRDPQGGAFVFGNIVEVYSPNKDFGKEDLDDVLQKVGVSPEKTQYPTSEALRVLAEKRLLSYFKTTTHDAGVYKASEATKQKDLADIEKTWGITPDDVIIEQGPDGRMQLNLTNEAAQKVLEFANIDGLYATTQGKNIDVVLGGANPGMQASSQRVFYGLFKTGTKTSSWSQETDMGTGGSDFVYLRPLKPGGNANNNNTRIFINPIEVVKRLDIFAYDNDSYGAKNPQNWNFKNWLGQYGNSGAGQPEMLKAAAKAQNGAPEIMVRHNIPLSAILGYVFNSTPSRNDAIQKLKSMGIADVNGVPIEEFIKLYGADGVTTLTPDNMG